MLNAIKEFFEKNINGPATTRGMSEHSIELATAALMIEVVRMDGAVDERERDAVMRAIQNNFHLTTDEAESLVGLAEQESKQATDLYQFTSLINKHLSHEQKADVIEHMWRVAYADNELSSYEQHVMRRIADLLYIPHATYVNAKMRAKPAT